MAFKSDRSFLDKVSMGAIGALHAKQMMTTVYGHNLIELERYSTTNKIWTTKVKRLRLPDLVCLRCGVRMEVRAKSKLTIAMSDSPTVPLRNWDYGLRDMDMVLLVHCAWSEAEERWVPSNIINAFTIGDMRATVNLSKLGGAKSASEGAERDRQWPSYVPTFDGTVEMIQDERLIMMKSDGRHYSYGLRRDDQTLYHAYVVPGEKFKAGTNILASVIPSQGHLNCLNNNYSFIDDLHSDNREDQYTAIKALGHLQNTDKNVMSRLQELARSNAVDDLVRLECFGTLARLDQREGWDGLEKCLSSDKDAIKMESVLILSELQTPQALALLDRVANAQSSPSELKAAAVWGLGRGEGAVNRLVKYLADPDPLVSVHAIARCTKYVNENTIATLLSSLGPDRQSAAIVRTIVESNFRNAHLLVNHLRNDITNEQRSWLLYLLGLLGRNVVQPALLSWSRTGMQISNRLNLFWDQHALNWTNTFENNDLIDFTLRQNI